jgi:ABC-type nitrate/sulfonate/bicarbonate transport system substrate-binding protein
MVTVKLSTLSRNYFNLPLWVAQHEGLFRDEGLSVEFEIYESIDMIAERLRDGYVQFSRGTTEHVILDRESGGHQEIIGGNLNKLPFSLIGAKHIARIEDLRGGRVGVSAIRAGSSSLIMKIFEGHGLHYPADYTLVPCGPIMARWEKLQSGEIDAGLQGVPLNHIALDEGYSDLGDMRTLFPDFQFSSLHVDGRWAADNHETVVAFMRSWIKAHTWIFTNRKASSRIAAAESGVDLHYAERAWDEYIGGAIFPEDATVSVAAVQALIDVSALIRALPTRSAIRAETYINGNYIEEAAASLSG